MKKQILIYCILGFFMLGFSIRSLAQNNKVVLSENSNPKNPTFVITEEMPAFPGGESERIKFMQQNLVYPVVAKLNGVQGTVYAQFVVDKRGKVVEAKILKGIGSGCDEECLRIIKIMPRWKPGRVNGKKVRVLFNMPVCFTL
ncbi:MAG: energy transducer TonB [Bacteroidota bacterium]